jgi:hypothetical protein
MAALVSSSAGRVLMPAIPPNQREAVGRRMNWPMVWMSSKI